MGYDHTTGLEPDAFWRCQGNCQVGALQQHHQVSKDVACARHSYLASHFQQLEKTPKRTIAGLEHGELVGVNQADAEKVLFDDKLFRALVVQRSRAYGRSTRCGSRPARLQKLLRSARGGRERLRALVFAKYPEVLDL